MADFAGREPELRILSLTTGGGGLDLGVELAVGGARIVCGVEHEAFAVEYLAKAMEAGCVDPFPVWSDLKTFDGSAWRGCVDILTAGYPCQPFSIAGRQRGSEDPRHLWPDVLRVVRECEPPVCLFENVGNHVRKGFDEVARSLEEVGYDVAACLFTAEETGASHKRERLFILAVRGELAHGEHSEPGQREEGVQGQERLGRGRSADQGEGDVFGSLADDHGQLGEGLGVLPREGRRGEQDADADGAGTGGRDRSLEHDPLVGRSEGRAESEVRSGRPAASIASGGSDKQALGNNNNTGSQGRGALDERADELTAGPAGSPLDAGFSLFPPGPGELDAWRDIVAGCPLLAPALPESAFRSMADGLAGGRRQWLQLLGNGVVPLQAAYAFCSLWPCLRLAQEDATPDH